MQLEVNRKPIPKGTIMEKEALVNLLDQISIQCDPDNIDYTFPTVIIEDDNEARQVEQRYLLSDAETAERASWLKAQCQSAEAALDSISEQDFASSSQSVNKDVTPEAQAATEILHPYEELIDFLDCLKSEMQESQKAYLSERKDVRILSFLLDNEQAMQELVSIVSKSPTEQNIFSLFWGDNDYLTVKKYLAENQQGTPAFKLACTLFTETVLPNADVARKTLEKRKAALNQLEQDAIKKQFIFSWARYLGNPAIAKAGNFAHTVQLSLIAQELTGSMERAGFIDRIKLREKYGEDFSWYEFTGNNLRKQIFENRLRTELTPAHSLFEKGKDLVAVAKSERNDDVLFWDGVDYYIVHLTWGKGNAHFPIYKIIHQNDIIEYLENDYLYG